MSAGAGGLPVAAIAATVAAVVVVLMSGSDPVDPDVASRRAIAASELNTAKPGKVGTIETIRSAPKARDKRRGARPEKREPVLAERPSEPPLLLPEPDTRSAAAVVDAGTVRAVDPSAAADAGPAVEVQGATTDTTSLPKPARLIVASVPRGARVFVDDKELCQTPCEVDLPPIEGESRLRVTKRLFHPVEKTARFEPGETVELKLKLKPVKRKQTSSAGNDAPSGDGSGASTKAASSNSKSGTTNDTKIDTKKKLPDFRGDADSKKKKLPALKP